MTSGYGLGGYGSIESWGSIVYAGPPSQDSPGDFDFRVSARSEGYKIRVEFSVPSAEDSPDWNRRLVILRKQYEWPQAWDDSEAFILVDDIFVSEGSFLIDESNLVPNKIYYYSLFVQRYDGSWIIDRLDNRGSAYPYDRWGAADYMFESLPGGWRSADVEQNGDFQDFISLFGILVDDIKTDCEHLLTLFDYEEIHADLIQVLDLKIGWPTWHSAGGIKKRAESLNALALYGVDDPLLREVGTETGIGIGRAAAYIAILEEIAEWDAQLEEGWRYVMFSNGLYGSTTPDTTNVDTIRLQGRRIDILKYTNANNDWHSVSGLGFFMYEIPDVSFNLTTDILNRYLEMLAWSEASFVNTNLQLVPISEELFSQARILDDWEDVITYTGIYPLIVETDLGYTTSDASLFTSNAAASTTNTLADRTYHEALEYA